LRKARRISAAPWRGRSVCRLKSSSTMSRNKKIVLGMALAIIGAVAYFAIGILYTLSHLKEAYAAWDTGTLLVEYMRSHDDRWPSSWDDLLTILNTDYGRTILLRGAQAGDIVYARSLGSMVAVDWTFNPRQPDYNKPISRPDGTAFPVVWKGAEPNEMVSEYLAERAGTQPTSQLLKQPPLSN